MGTDESNEVIKDSKFRQIMRTENKAFSITGFIALLIIYAMASAATAIISKSQDVIVFGGYALRVASLTGILSALSNMCIIFIVVFFKKPGFVVSFVILLLQFPILFMRIFVQHYFEVLPGFISNLLSIVTIILIFQRNNKIDKYQKTEIEYFKEKQLFSQRLFEQTATALVNAIDAKDTYSHGHSVRVAEYSEMIAKRLGKTEEDCQRIYYAALLHDVGKIGISNSIINKKGKLTTEEYEVIKQHPVIGNQVLSSINEYPYLSIGAHYHHERYDGKGYPDKLKGEDIPEVARIISVADAYDAMTSNRSYREAIPQQLVREEIVKGSGTQFDPQFAMIMQTLIDEDPDYLMREKKTVKELSGRSGLKCREFKSEISDGIIVTPFRSRIHLEVSPEENSDHSAKPAMILFDSLDGRVQDDERIIREMNYYEYAVIFLDGHCEKSGVRNIETEETINEKAKNTESDKSKSVTYDIETLRIKDHVQINIDNGTKTVKIILALPDSSRYAYIGLTGEHCYISDVSITTEEEPAKEDSIKRIAEEITYISGPAGDLPNIQIDGYRSDATEGIEVTDGMKITFHTLSLPTARLIWHCPYIDLFYSKDKQVQGEDYREFALIRLDGENWESKGVAVNDLIVNKNEKFEGWDNWKKENKNGFECEVTFKKEEDKIIVTTENLGISIRNTTIITDGTKDVYVALTGDQCALTNIRIEK